MHVLHNLSGNRLGVHQLKVLQLSMVQLTINVSGVPPDLLRYKRGNWM